MYASRRPGSGERVHATYRRVICPAVRTGAAEHPGLGQVVCLFFSAAAALHAPAGFRSPRDGFIDVWRVRRTIRRGLGTRAMRQSDGKVSPRDRGYSGGRRTRSPGHRDARWLARDRRDRRADVMQGAVRVGRRRAVKQQEHRSVPPVRGTWFRSLGRAGS